MPTWTTRQSRARPFARSATPTRAEPFNADGVKVKVLISQQSGEINAGVVKATDDQKEQGAGDQGIMFGYATSESAELMPLTLVLAHRLTKGLADDRHSGKYPWLRPDAKSQVSVVYTGNTPVRVSSVLVSTQHSKDVSQAEIRDYVVNVLAPRAPWASGSPRTPSSSSIPAAASPSAARRPTAASPAARSSSTATAAPAGTAAARSAARTRPRSTAAAPTTAATSPAASCRRAWRSAPRSRCRTPSDEPSRCR